MCTLVLFKYLKYLNSNFENRSNDFLLRCQNTLRWEITYNTGSISWTCQIISSTRAWINAKIYVKACHVVRHLLTSLQMNSAWRFLHINVSIFWITNPMIGSVLVDDWSLLFRESKLTSSELHNPNKSLSISLFINTFDFFSLKYFLLTF